MAEKTNTPAGNSPGGIVNNTNAGEVEAHNTEVAQKLAGQDIMGHNNAPVDDGSASGALDALMKQAEEDAKNKTPDKTPEPAASTPPAKTPEELEKEKADAEAAEAEKKRAEELFKDSPQLPPGASPKSSVAFTALKVKAAQDISAREAEIEKLRKENSTLADKLKIAATPEERKELEELRNWRTKLDVEADPQWKSFDKKVEVTREFIYAQLSRSPVVSKDVIDAIKKHGGPDKVQMDKILPALNDPALQRTIESKLADIEQTKFEKQQAVESAKSNISEYVANRTKEAEAAQVKHNSDTEKHLGDLVKQLSWLSDKTADAKATEADRKSVEDHNAFIKTTREQMAVAAKDDSPEMRAIMIAGMAQLFYLQKVHGGVVAENEALKKSLSDVTAKFDKLRSASVTRLRESNASPDTPAPVSKTPNYSQSTGDALDDLRKQVTEERERAAAAANR